MATKRLFQLVVARELQGGVVAAGIDPPLAANATLLVSDPKVTYDRATFERSINRASLTPLTPLEGVVEAAATFRVELAGTSAAVGTAPDWGLLLEACGLKQAALYRAGVGAIAADGAPNVPLFFSEETITATQTARVIHDTWNGSTKIFTAEDLGITGGAVGGTSASTATITAGSGPPVEEGFAWTPVSRPIVSLDFGPWASGSTGVVAGSIYIGRTSGAVLQAIDTVTSHSGPDATFYLIDPGEFLVGEETIEDVNGQAVGPLTTANFTAQTDVPAISMALIEDGTVRALKGCRGAVTFSANIGEPMFMDFSFKGLISSISDGALSGTPTPTALVPPSFLEISYGVANDSPAVSAVAEHTPCINTWSCEYANEVSIEKCAASTDGTRGSAILTGRAVTGGIDPSVRPEASFPWLDNLRNGTTFRQRLTLGSEAANSFHISLPSCQLTSEGDGDREGLATRDLQYSASGKSADGTDREDREFVLTYHQNHAFVR